MKVTFSVPKYYNASDGLATIVVVFECHSLGAYFGSTYPFQIRINSWNSVFDETVIDTNDTTTYKAVRFFDMMLRKAIETNVEKHLWLYYYERFAIKIIASPGKSIVSSQSKKGNPFNKAVHH